MNVNAKFSNTKFKFNKLKMNKSSIFKIRKNSEDNNIISVLV